MGILRCAFRLIRNFVIIFFVVALIPGLPPKTTFEFEEFSIKRPRTWTGPLSFNTDLNNAERLFEGRIIGPESMVVHGNEIYASLSTEVVKITGNHLTHVAKFGKPCEASYDEETCGRPLGLKLDTISNSLVVADAYYGIWLVDLDTHKKTLLLSSETVYGGKVPRKAKLFNHLAIAQNGDIFWSDTSSDYDRANFLMTFFANPSGRLFHYNRATKVNKVLLDTIYQANGVALSPNEDFVLVAETGALQILRYHLKGPNAGKSDVFVDALPTSPDNLTPDSDGVWIPGSIKITKEIPPFWIPLARTPIIRRFLVRFVHLLEMPFKTLHNIYPTYYTRAIVSYIGSIESIGIVMPKESCVVRVDWMGNVVGSLQGNDGSVIAIADVAEKNGFLYLGSYKNRYLARVKLPERFLMEKSKKSAKLSADRTTTTTAAPRTTTTTERPRTTTTTAAPRTTTTTEKPRTTTTTAAPRTTTTTAAPRTTTTTEAPKTSTTTAAPRTTTTTAAPRTTTTTAAPRTTTTTAAPRTTGKTIPIDEPRSNDVPPPAPEKLRIIKRGGEQGEL